MGEYAKICRPSSDLPHACVNCKRASGRRKCTKVLPGGSCTKGVGHHRPLKRQLMTLPLAHQQERMHEVKISMRTPGSRRWSQLWGWRCQYTGQWSFTTQV